MGKTKTKCPSLPLLLGSTQQNSNMAYLALNSLVTSNYLTIKDSRGKSHFGKKLLTLRWLQRTCKYMCNRDVSLIIDFKGTLHQHWEHKQVANSHPVPQTTQSAVQSWVKTSLLSHSEVSSSKGRNQPQQITPLQPAMISLDHNKHFSQ